MDLPNFLAYLTNFERDRLRKMELYEKSSGNKNNVTKVYPLKDQETFLGLTDEKFQICFGLPKNIVNDLIYELYLRSFYSPEHDSFASSRVPFNISVLATLSYLVHGHLEHFMSLPYDAARNYSKFKLMRCVAHECEKIVLFLTPAYVTFPYAEEQIRINKLAFMQTFGLPGVLGVLDCFFVRLQNVPVYQREKYLNRHNNTAINVQVICDHSYRFLDVNARFSGITGDIYIWKRSHVQHIVQNIYMRDKKTWLVADRGYRLDSFLMNPFRNAITPEQNALNTTFKNVRGVLDKAIAILKARFGCLKTELPFNHQQCSNIITACVTLHNYLLAKRYPIEESIVYSIPRKLELRNATHEDKSCDGILNRNFLANFQYHNFWRSIIRKNSEESSN